MHERRRRARVLGDARDIGRVDGGEHPAAVQGQNLDVGREAVGDRGRRPQVNFDVCPKAVTVGSLNRNKPSLGTV